MRRYQGFTLIELMIVVVIVAILAAIAYPSYRQSVMKSRRADCEGALMSLANAAERFFTVNNTYVGTAGAGNVPTIFAAQCPVDGGTPTYNLTIVPTATTYTLSATPIGSQAGEKCGILTLDQAGQKGVNNGNGLTAVDCW
jgi:type IV pilus assembly protein PilE